MSLRRSATVATILATAAATIAGGGLLPAANAVIDHSATSQPGGVENADASAQDSRTGNPLVQPTTDQLAAANQLVAAAGDGARVTWDGRFGTPRTIYADAGQSLSGTHDGSAADAARSFVDKNRAAFGLSTDVTVTAVDTQ